MQCLCSFVSQCGRGGQGVINVLKMPLSIIGERLYVFDRSLFQACNMIIKRHFLSLGCNSTQLVKKSGQLVSGQTSNL